MTNPEQPAVDLAELDSMCMTWRHDYGLMSQGEREQLRSTLYQLWVHHVLPLQRDLAEAKGERDAAVELLHQTAHALGLNLHADVTTNQHLVGRAAYLSEQFTVDRYTATETALAQAKKNLDTACMYSRMHDAAESSNAKLREMLKEARASLSFFATQPEQSKVHVYNLIQRIDALTQSPEDRS